MRHSLFPDDYVASTYRIDFAALARQGYRGIIFDVDNTLVPHGAPADERAKKLFEELHTLGYRCILLSNNKEPRVKRFSEDVIWTDYIYKAGKPKPGNYKKAMEIMGTDERSTIFVGDQIFTDVLGARRCGFWSFCVEPICGRDSLWHWTAYWLQNPFRLPARCRRRQELRSGRALRGKK